MRIWDWGIEDWDSAFRVAHSRCAFALRVGVVREVHDVIEIAMLSMLADVMDGDLARVRAGDGLEALDAGQFAFVRPVMIEEAAVDDLDGKVRTGEIAGKPDLAVGSATDAAQDGVIGNDGRWEWLLGG